MSLYFCTLCPVTRVARVQIMNACSPLPKNEAKKTKNKQQVGPLSANGRASSNNYDNNTTSYRGRCMSVAGCIHSLCTRSCVSVCECARLCVFVYSSDSSVSVHVFPFVVIPGTQPYEDGTICENMMYVLALYCTLYVRLVCYSSIHTDCTQTERE